MPSNIDTLLEMGFPRNRAEKALHKTNYKGVDAAMDWLFAHQDDPDIDDPFDAPKGYALGTSSDNTSEQNVSSETDEPTPENGSNDPTTNMMQPMSLKCDDCNKLLKNEDAVQLHAAKTGHSNFSESTEEVRPLTEEEKQQQFAKIQEKLKIKRLEKEENERQETIKREKMRRVQGKDLTAAKQKLKDDELKHMSELKHREKMEEKLARQKVRDQIEQDKKNRAVKFAKKSEPPAEKPVEPSTVAATTVKKDYEKCRLQIRLMSGLALTETFDAKQQLLTVRQYVQSKIGIEAGPFSLMTNFPKKLFSEEDMVKPLTELGLVPSAVLIVTKPK